MSLANYYYNGLALSQIIASGNTNTLYGGISYTAANNIDGTAFTQGIINYRTNDVDIGPSALSANNGFVFHEGGNATDGIAGWTAYNDTGPGALAGQPGYTPTYYTHDFSPIYNYNNNTIKRIRGILVGGGGGGGGGGASNDNRAGGGGGTSWPLYFDLYFGNNPSTNSNFSFYVTLGGGGNGGAGGWYGQGLPNGGLGGRGGNTHITFRNNVEYIQIISSGGIGGYGAGNGPGNGQSAQGSNGSMIYGFSPSLTIVTGPGSPSFVPTTSSNTNTTINTTSPSGVSVYVSSMTSTHTTPTNTTTGGSYNYVFNNVSGNALTSIRPGGSGGNSGGSNNIAYSGGGGYSGVYRVFFLTG